MDAGSSAAGACYFDSACEARSSLNFSDQHRQAIGVGQPVIKENETILDQLFVVNDEDGGVPAWLTESVFDRGDVI